ncbi:MAG: acyl dehydratase [Burkholderiales bacterium]|nr:acyl dehydratase [Burkholderiales bacterium]MDE2395438.1 acyl dehydratase [Burkholderiales bacterium]MDE2454544.1 acyl dehydratase [Burkholderiales bacterium]
MLRLHDLNVGLAFETGAIDVTESHIVAFAGLSGDFFDLHMDDAFARAEGFAGRVAHGLLGLALIDGLKNRGAIRLDAIASLEWNWRFVAPIYAGDRIRGRIEVLSARPTRHPGRGVVRLGIEALNQQGRTVQEGSNTLLVRDELEPGASR